MVALWIINHYILFKENDTVVCQMMGIFTGGLTVTFEIIKGILFCLNTDYGVQGFGFLSSTVKKNGQKCTAFLNTVGDQLKL